MSVRGGEHGLSCKMVKADLGPPWDPPSAAKDLRDLPEVGRPELGRLPEVGRPELGRLERGTPPPPDSRWRRLCSFAFKRNFARAEGQRHLGHVQHPLHHEDLAGLVRDEPRGGDHVRAELVDLLLTGAGLPGVGEAVLHVAERGLALERREVHADHGVLAHEARVPEEVEVASHARLVCVHDGEVEGRERALAHLLRQLLQALHRRAHMRGDLAPGEALRSEALAELHDEGVDLDGVHLPLLRERLGQRQRRHAAEAADLQHASRLAGRRHHLEKVAALGGGRPISAHADRRQALLKVVRPVLVLDGLHELLQRRAGLGGRPGGGARPDEVLVGERRRRHRAGGETRVHRPCHGRRHLERGLAIGGRAPLIDKV
mmetsp:Transcript_13019/g.34421  ORF Transcript_13019/g.34421 Transcript_13019/m.34421 type:complete len:375 (+) Transcript_13019:127-1251(+)